jgi:hypothetical protein
MKIKPKIQSKPEIQESKPKIQSKLEIQRKARATGKKKIKNRSSAARKQPEGPLKEAETAGEANGEARVWRRGPIHRRSSTQKSETPTATRAENGMWRPPAAVPTAVKNRPTTESPPERHVDDEEAPKPIDLQPKKRMNQNSHPQWRCGNHRDGNIGKD